ncbi:protein of unknown function [Streptantibioticus cattleyicolor NRRL 8057 = DSM 46488]|nr:protein of unknown function [Streptantibioticus cattleyicolor NRRL 8057 = DSM 46488]
MVLQDRHDGARHGAQGAVERGQRTGAPLVPHPHRQPPGLELVAVGGRGQLAVLALGGDPRLAVELARGGGAQVAGGHVDHLERQPQRAEPLLLPGQQPLVLRLGLLGGDEAEHLHLVELVDAEDASGVLAVGAGLPAEAGRETGVAQREPGRLDDLVHVVGGQRDLGGADQVVVVLLQVVDVLRGLAEEAGALHGARLDQRGGEHRGEAGLGGLRDRRVDQGQLQQGADTGEVVEARAGDLGGALDVDGAECLAELQVVLGLEALGGEVARGADGLQDGEVLLAADRHVRVDEVADAQQQGLGLLGRQVLLGVGGLDRGGQLAGLLQQPGLLLAGGLGDELAQRLLLRAQFVEAVTGRPAPLVGGEQGVDQADVLSTGALGGAHSVGVLTKQAKVDHGYRLPAGRLRPRQNKSSLLANVRFWETEEIIGDPHCPSTEFNGIALRSCIFGPRNRPSSRVSAQVIHREPRLPGRCPQGVGVGCGRRS